MKERYYMGKADQRLGKKGEFKVFGELLARNLTIYPPLFDVEGIDCVVRNKNNAHIDIQVKTRTDNKLWDVSELKPREDLFIIVYVTEPKEQFWVLPSKIYDQYSRKIKYKGKKTSRLIINKNNESALHEYYGDYAFDKLVDFGTGKHNFSKTKNVLKPHIQAEHYKQPDFYPIVMGILKSAGRPLKRQEIVNKVKEQIYERFSDADKVTLKNGDERWKNTLRFAISHLAMQKKITSKTKNQWQVV